MDPPDGPVFDALFYPDGLPDGLEEGLNRVNEAIEPDDNDRYWPEMRNMQVWHRFPPPQRPRRAQDGSGDGPDQNPAQPDQVAPALVLFRGVNVPNSWTDLESMLPLMMVISSTFLKRMLTWFGVETQTTFVFGLSYDTHFMFFQCILAFAAYWYKSYRGW